MGSECLRYSFGAFGNAASLLLYLSPMMTFLKIVKKKSTEGFSCVPYIVAITNCLVITWYGSPIVSNGWEQLPVVSINALGIFLQLSYIIIYFCFASSKEQKTSLVKMALITLTFCGSIVLASIFAIQNRHHRKTFVGYFLLTTSIALFASPLVVVKKVVKSKSVEFMPFCLSFFSLMASTAWLVYGLLSRDFILWAPNALGSPLSIFQLMLYCKYKERGGKGRECDEKWDIEIQTPAAVEK